MYGVMDFSIMMMLEGVATMMEVSEDIDMDRVCLFVTVGGVLGDRRGEKRLRDIQGLH